MSDAITGVWRRQQIIRVIGRGSSASLQMQLCAITSNVRLLARATVRSSAIVFKMENIRGGVLVASVGSGKGGDLGAGRRDAHCQSLTAAVRAGHARAY